ncbi:hypothetical protein ACFLS1_05915, partial [Verrucomicrobiota bacterium]
YRVFLIYIFSADKRSDPPHVRCRISMGKQSLIMESGFNPRAEMVVTQREQEIVNKKCGVKESDTSGDFTFYPLKRYISGIPYTVKVKMDLSPFWGILEGCDTTDSD